MTEYPQAWISRFKFTRTKNSASKTGGLGNGLFSIFLENFEIRKFLFFKKMRKIKDNQKSKLCLKNSKLGPGSNLNAATCSAGLS
jgi:hypothetical protein